VCVGVWNESEEIAEGLDSDNGAGEGIVFPHRKLNVTEGGRRQIEGNGVVGGPQLAQHLQEHLGQAVDRVDLLPGARDSHRRQGVISAVQQGMAVNEDKERLTFHLKLL